MVSKAVILVVLRMIFTLNGLHYFRLQPPCPFVETYISQAMAAYCGSFSAMLGCEGPAAGARVFNDGRFTYEPLADVARLADDVVLLNCLLTCSNRLSIRSCTVCTSILSGLQ